MTNKLISKLILLLFIGLLPCLSHAKVIHSEHSLYRKVYVEDKDDLRCLKFSLKRRTSSQSCINLKTPKKLVFNYTKLLMSSLLLLENKPNNILIIGLGGGTMSNTLHELYPNANITNVEIDPAVIKVARKYFDLIENDKVKTVAKDGRIFIKRAKLKKQKFDMIILDAFNGEYIPEHLMTKEFLSETKDVLTINGIVAANTFSSSQLYNYETATYAAVFPVLFNVEPDSKSNRVLIGKNENNINGQKREQKANFLNEELIPFNVKIHTYLPHIKSDIKVNPSAKILTDQYSPANLLKN